MNEGFPEAWTRWSDEPDRTVFVYRPDVFDSEAFPAACIPTLYLSHGPHRNRRPEQRRPGAGPDVRSDDWYVTLYLEPEVVLKEERHEGRGPALEAGSTMARRFATGGFDYRSAYQVPREAYLDRLDELTGRDP